MSEKNEKKKLENENFPETSPSIQNEIPRPPVESIEVNQSEKDLDLLKNEEEVTSTPLENLFPELDKATEEVFEEVAVETFPDETVFKYPVDGQEKTAYENILKANRETIKSLRSQVQEATATIESLRVELEAKNKEV